MNSTEKLSAAVQSMRKESTPWCHHLGAIRLVIEKECESSEALADVKAQIEKMQSLCRQMCVGYDNLRALMGRLEREQGIGEPRFWPGEIKESGQLAKCQIATCGPLASGSR